jgi:hypothetical protein
MPTKPFVRFGKNPPIFGRKRQDKPSPDALGQMRLACAVWGGPPGDPYLWLSPGGSRLFKRAGHGIDHSRIATIKSMAAVASTSPRIIIRRSAAGFWRQCALGGLIRHRTKRPRRQHSIFRSSSSIAGMIQFYCQVLAQTHRFLAANHKTNLTPRCFK